MSDTWQIVCASALAFSLINTVVVVYALGVIEDWMKKQDQLCDKRHGVYREVAGEVAMALCPCDKHSRGETDASIAHDSWYGCCEG